MYQKILLPLDGSSHAEVILPHVEKLAKGFGAHVILLYVDETPDLMLERDEVIDMDAYIQKHREQIKGKEAYLQAIIDEWKAKGHFRPNANCSWNGGGRYYGLCRKGSCGSGGHGQPRNGQGEKGLLRQRRRRCIESN